MDTTDAIVATEADYTALLNDPRRPLSRFVEVSLAYGRMLTDLDPQRAAEVLSLALETLHDPPAPAEAEVVLELIRALRPVAARLRLAGAELDAIRRERRLLDAGLAVSAPGEREWLCRRAAAVHFAGGEAAAGFAELMNGLRGCSTIGLDDLASDMVLAVRRLRVPVDVVADLESMWVELRRQRFDGNWPLWCLTALGSLRLDADDVVTAQMYLRRAESILGHLERPVAGVLVGGWVALAAGDFARAHDRFTFAVNAASPDERLRLLAAAGLGESLVCLGRPEEARAPLAEAIAYEIGDPFTVGRSHELLAEIAAADGRYADAYRHLQVTRHLELVGRGVAIEPLRVAVPAAATPATADVRTGEPAIVDLRDPDVPEVAEVPYVSSSDRAESPLPTRTTSELVGLDPADLAAALVTDALRMGWLRLHFHEIHDNVAHRAGAAEGLLRLEHPEWGLLDPEVFLAPLTDAALARSVCEWTLDRACDTLVRWNAGSRRFAIVVNVDARQLSPQLPSLVRNALARSGAPADLLTVELDGSAAAEIDQPQIGLLTEIRATGARIGIDRFGGGFRSIDTLLLLPVDVVKFDRSVFGGDAFSPSDRRMVETVVALATTFRFEVIATGIENPPQFDLQQQMGCHGAQGFLIGRPVAESEFRDRLADVA